MSNAHDKESFDRKLAALGHISDEQKRAVVCALVGHSKIQSAFFGYFSCARCGEQVGDSLAGVYRATGVVIMGHNCAECRENYAALPWSDKYLAPDPFAENEGDARPQATGTIKEE